MDSGQRPSRKSLLINLKYRRASHAGATKAVDRISRSILFFFKPNGLAYNRIEQLEFDPPVVRTGDHMGRVFR